MKQHHLFRAGQAALAGIAFVSSASAAVSIDWVTVGNPGNPNDSTGYGAVADTYNISKYEVTMGQYTEFLNAVDPGGSNTRALYNGSMSSNANIAGIGFNNAAASGFKYSVIGSSNRPVTYVNWFDAARFSNWMHNGQGAGDTESGAYTLIGPDSGVTQVAVAGAKYRLPTENEWYKAAYHDPVNALADGSGTADYWLYPTRSDSAPGNTIGAAANQANYYAGDYAVTQSTAYSSSQNYLTDAGAYSGSASYYGTFDQGGNVYEWNDAVIGSSRGLRGGSWGYSVVLTLKSSDRLSLDPASENTNVGFRLATVPEPSSVLMVGLAGVALLTRRRRPPL